MKLNRNAACLAMPVMAGIVICCAPVSFAGAGNELLIRALSRSPKINEENSPLPDFAKGLATARVIVNVRDPAGTPETSELIERGARRQVPAMVRTAQNRVIESLNPGEARVTNRFSYIYGFSTEVTLQGLQDLLDNADVVSVENDRILEAHLAQGIPLMNASDARNDFNGAGLSIAICDTGIDYTHPRLGGGGFPNSKVIGGYDCGDDDSNPMDAQGHGTCCAGIAAGDLGTTGDYIGGVAYNARLYAVKIAHGSTGNAYTSDMIQGWEWCVTHQYDNPGNPIMIISTSFGGYRYYSTCDSASTAMTAAAANAVAAGITLFASSGNDGYCDSIGWPACISHVISVGAVYDASFGLYQPCVSANSCATKYAGGCSSGWYAKDSTYADMVTSYSNTYSYLGLLAPSNKAYTTDIVGAGGYSSGDYYNSFGGTSAASPYAAGAAACLQSAARAISGSFLSPGEVRSKLIETGDSVTDGKISITKPRINLGNAVDSLPPAGPTATPSPEPPEEIITPPEQPPVPTATPVPPPSGSSPPMYGVLNAASFAPGERLTLDLVVADPPDEYFDIYAGIMSGGTFLYSFRLGNPYALQGGMKAVGRRIFLADPARATIFIADPLPPAYGTYSCVIGLVKAGKSASGRNLVRVNGNPCLWQQDFAIR